MASSKQSNSSTKINRDLSFQNKNSLNIDLPSIGSKKDKYGIANMLNKRKQEMIRDLPKIRNGRVNSNSKESLT